MGWQRLVLPYCNMVKNMYNRDIYFEWDDVKNAENIEKHGISFEEAQKVFADRQRVVWLDKKHSHGEKREFCVGSTGEGIATVRFTIRGNVIRIFGAGYWRKGRRIYETRNRIHGRPS